MQKSRIKVDPLDKDVFFRWFHLHCFTHIYRIWGSNEAKNQFAEPRFELFKKIRMNKWKDWPFLARMSLFVRILLTFFKQIIIGALITIFFSCLNLLIPLMIKNFLHFMHSHHVDKNEISSTQLLIQGFLVLQLLRIIFGEHSKRLFFQLAIKVESSLSLMIVKKSLTISHEIRNKISQSQILQLENIDLKLVFTMFQNMYLAIQAPFTILVTIYLLYLQNYKYGLIGIYWFVIAFLVQRELDSKMTHCNDTKLKLIEARSKINYDILGKIRVAKLLGHQELLIQKNNDYFIAENHDHKMFYEYVTLYDISLILLPILVIVTIALYDLNQPDQISVSQVYVLLSLLGICYGPMKSFRTLTLNFHDGLRSLSRIGQFLKHADQPPSKKLILKYLTSQKSSFKISMEENISELANFRNQHKATNEPLLIIKNHLVIEPAKQNQKLQFVIDMQQNLHFFRGQRLVVIGKIGSGVESFFEGLIGLKKIKQGHIILNDRIAYLGGQHFFRNTSIRQNIRFFNQYTTDEQIESVYRLLKLDQDLKLTPGLQGNIDDQYKYNSVQLHKIALARVFCSNADIYLLDKVFQPLNTEDEKLVQEILRQKQYDGKLIILTNYTGDKFEKDDKIMIVNKGKVIQLKEHQDLVKNKNQQFAKFYHYKSEKQSEESQRRDNIFSHFGFKLSQSFSLTDYTLTKKQEGKVIEQLINPVLQYGVHLWKQYKEKQYNSTVRVSIKTHIWRFLTAVKFKEFIYIFLIIAVAELMHIFIHFYIGHLQEEHGQNNYVKFKNMIIIQFVLTLGLSGIIWLEGQVSSQIAIIQGNTLYNKALVALGQNKLSWFEKQYSVKIANRFNHDYEEVFIMLHVLLGIYKNIVILIATIYFLAQSKKSLVIMTLGITATYLTVYYILRNVERKVVNYYEEYKYHYVRVLEQSIGGAKLIELNGASNQVLKNARKAYTKFASYKIAESYTSYGEQILCDLVSLVIFTAVLNYGLQSKVEGNTKSIAQIATMIHLLIGVFDVLKNIVKDSINMETFFKINLLPFVEIIKEKTPETIKIEKYIESSIQRHEKEVIQQALSITKIKKTQSQTENVTQEDLSNVLGKMVQSIEFKTQKTPTKRKLKLSRKCTIQTLCMSFYRYDIEFKNVILHESKYHQPVFQVYPLNLRINQGQRVLFYESNDYLKNYLIYGLTKNLPMFFNPEIMALERTEQEMIAQDKTIVIGGRDICCIQKAEMEKIVQIMIDHDFYVQGTLEDNIAWRNPNFDEEEIMRYAEELKLVHELPRIKKQKLKARIKQPSKQLIKKITLLRILSLKPKILIFKDTESIIQNYLLVDEITNRLGPVTIIKISSNIDEAFDIDRIIYCKNLQVLEDKSKQDALNHPFSQIGQDLRKANMDGLVYMNQMNTTLIGAKFGPESRNNLA